MTEPDWIRMEAEGTRVAIDRRTGAIAEIESTETGWRIHDRSTLAISFRLLIPLAGRRNNLVYGEQQSPPEIELRDDCTQLVMRWPEVRSQHGGVHPIAVTQRVAVSGRQVLFSTTVDNRSELTVENVWAPCIGDLRPPSPEEELRSFCCSYGNASLLRMWPAFENVCGYWGVDYPTQVDGRPAKAGTVPVSPFTLILAGGQGVYVGVTERRYDLVTWRSELVPGYDDSLHGRASADAAIRFSTVHLPYVPPGQKRTLTPIAIEAFQGDWHHGVDIYRRWRDRSMSPPTTPRWANEPHSWLQLQINSPEDDLRIPFRELPEVGRECQKAGVRAIQLVGWNEGGQDQGNPSHQPDARLGTPDELRDAIAQIQALGVRVVLFCKFLYADRATERFGELVNDTVRDPYGDYYNGASYLYQTTTQLLGINGKHLIPMCFGSDRYLATCEVEFDRVVGLGADGMLFDESCHHADALLCFDTAHGHGTPWPVYAGDDELIRRFRRHTEHAPDFLYAGEGNYDWQFEQYHLSYFRSASTEHLPVNRYLLPDAALMTAVTGFDDNNMINQCLLYRYLVSYEPFNFKGRPRDFIRTMDYGRRMDELRTELREWFWDGTFRDTLGARVRCANGDQHHPYAVYLHRDSQHPAVAVANYRDEHVTVEVDGLGEDLTFRLVDDPAWRASRGQVGLPPRSAAVVVPARSMAAHHRDA